MGRSHAGPGLVVAVFTVTIMFSMAVSVYHLGTHQAPLLPTILGQWSLLVLSIAFAGGGYYALASVETWTERAIIGWRATIAYVLGWLASGGYAYHEHVTPEVEFGLDSVVFQATFVAVAAGIAGLVSGVKLLAKRGPEKTSKQPSTNSSGRMSDWRSSPASSATISAIP